MYMYRIIMSIIHESSSNINNSLRDINIYTYSPAPKKITLDIITKYFDLIINDAANKIGVCTSVLKKICRKNGIKRWPYRKIKSIKKIILTEENEHEKKKSV